VKHTDVLDWRVWKAAVIDKATGGPAKAGDQLYVVTTLKKSSLGNVTFITPSPAALALSSAITAARSANLKLATVTPVPGAGGAKDPWIAPAHLPHLYSYFEQAMTAAVFSFQALESFANQIVAERVTGTMQLKRRGGSVDLTAAEIERQCSTDEKLGTILGQLLGKATPKGKKPWQGFATLKDLRDATIHLKSRDQYVRGAPDKETLYFRLLNTKPTDYPRWAISLIRYFTGQASWLNGAEEALNAP
jgi:hypothetical protein